MASKDPRGVESRSLLHRFQRLSAYSVACFAMALFSVACFSAARARARALACWPRAIRPPKYCIEFRLMKIFFRDLFGGFKQRLF